MSGNEGHNSTVGTKLAQNGAELVQNGTKMGTKRDPVKLCDHIAKLDPKNCNYSIEVGTKLAQNGADLVQHGVKMEPKFVPAIELLEYGFPVSSPSGDEPSGACASSAASSSIT